MSIAVRAAAWRTTTQILLWRHGWGWPLAASAGVLAAASYFFVTLPETAALAAARLELSREALSPQPVGAASQARTEQQHLQALKDVLRQSPDAGEIVRRMASMAQAEQIVLSQSDYQHQFHAGNQVTQVQITQPVRASYPQLRRYIEAVLRNIPNASLDHVAARRDNVGQSQLEVRLRWSVWLQSAEPTATKSPQREATP